MKITKIEIKKDSQGITLENSKKKLSPVIVTAKKRFGKEFTFNAYPTNYGPTYGSDTIIFYYYCDENGKQLGNELSQQINNWLLKEQMNKPVTSTNHI